MSKPIVIAATRSSGAGLRRGAASGWVAWSLGSIGVVAVVIVAVKAMFGLEFAAPIIEPPVPESWDGLEPLVSVACRAALDEVQLDEQDAVAWAELAMTYHANDLVDLAVPCWTQAVGLDPTHAPWWFLLGRCRAEVGDVAGALDAVDRAIELESAAWFLFWRKGGWLLEAGDVEGAAAAFMTAIERAAEIQDPAGRVGLARAYLQSGRNEEALELLEPLVGRRPPVPNAEHVANLLGQTYQRLGRAEEAAPLLAIQPPRGLTWSDPWSDTLYRRRRFPSWVIMQASEMIRGGDPRGALVHLAPLASSHADDPAMLKTKGLAHYSVGDLEQARAALERALEIAPDDASAHLNLSLIHEVEMRWPAALHHADEAVRLDGGSMQSRVQRGRILLMSGAVEAAEQELEAVVAAHPGRSNPLVWLARARAEAGHLDAASALLVDAARANSNDPDLPAAMRRVEALKVPQR